MTEFSVLIVGRRRVFLETLAMWLGEEPAVELVGDVTEPSRLVVDGPPVVDVALVDLGLPVGDLLALGGALRTANPSVALVALPEAGLDHRATAAMTAGFTGWVAESDSCEDVLDVLRTVHGGRTRVPTELLVHAVHQLHRGGRAPAVQDRRLASLTVREREVLDMLAEGLDKEAIAARLYISPHTVRTHQQHVLGKLRVHTTLAAVSVLRTAAGHQPSLSLVPGPRPGPRPD